MPSNSFAPYRKYHTFFIVKNITPDPDHKTIQIFQYPIPYHENRDLLQIPGVAEDDIRASVLKGELRRKFMNRDIELVYSNIDILQFSEKQKQFLYSIGFKRGVEIGLDDLAPDVKDYIDSHGGSGVGINYAWRENIELIGIKNGINRQFFVPEYFLDGNYSGNQFSISIFHNGRKLAKGQEFTIGEAGGPGTGFNVINYNSFSPISSNTIKATYAVKV